MDKITIDWDFERERNKTKKCSRKDIDKKENSQYNGNRTRPNRTHRGSRRERCAGSEILRRGRRGACGSRRASTGTSAPAAPDKRQREEQRRTEARFPKNAQRSRGETSRRGAESEARALAAPAARTSLPDPNVFSLVPVGWARRRRSCAPLQPADRLQNAGKRERKGIENRTIFNARGDICTYAPGI